MSALEFNFQISGQICLYKSHAFSVQERKTLTLEYLQCKCGMLVLLPFPLPLDACQVGVRHAGILLLTKLILTLVISKVHVHVYLIPSRGI